MTRAGKMTGARRAANRPTARLMPAVEYLQQQRLRMMMMMELAEATKDVDVYLVASNNGGAAAAGADAAEIRRIRGGRRRSGRGGEPGGDPAGRGAASRRPAARPERRGAAARRTRRGGAGGGGGPRSGIRRWRISRAIRRSTCPTASPRPASPTNVTFFARPFGEAELLALAKAYQDAAGHHLKKPTKLDA